jgi:hypothetical protein
VALLACAAAGLWPTGGCASTPRPGLAARGVRVLAVLPPTAAPGVVLAAPHTSTVAALIGRALPQDAVRDELVGALLARGYRVQSPGLTADRLRRAASPPTPADLGVDGVVQTRVLAWDAHHLDTQGRMRLVIEVAVLGAGATPLWSAVSAPAVLQVMNPLARRDYRRYVQLAVARALDTLP